MVCMVEDGKPTPDMEKTMTNELRQSITDYFLAEGECSPELHEILAKYTWTKEEELEAKQRAEWENKPQHTNSNLN